MSTHYFSHLGGPSAVSKNGPSVHIMTNLCFCIRWDLRVTYCILVRLHRKISMHYFSCSGGPGMDSTKIAMGDALHSRAFGPQNVDELFFMPGWGQYGFHKKQVKRCYTELVFFHPV
jgi:hypothetical protein